jgi:hypothetical protein
MSDATSALLAALDRIDVRAVADSLDTPEAAPAEDTLDAAAQDQFLHAFVALLREGLEGGGEQRELVMETAVPALISSGRTSVVELVAGHVGFFMALSQRLLAEVGEDVREDAGAWMTRYATDYTREVTERALAAERGG